MMGELQGRILQAHNDGDTVLTRKTRLFLFEPLEDARRLVEIFMQNMASEPIGNTREI